MMVDIKSAFRALLQLLLVAAALGALAPRGVLAAAPPPQAPAPGAPAPAAGDGASSGEVQLTARLGEDLGAALAVLSQPGPPAAVRLTGNISTVDVPGPRPAIIARNATIFGAGRPQHTELDLHLQYNRWAVARGAALTLRNLTLSNLAPRPDSDAPPPPANFSVFAFPVWFVQTDRCGCARRAGQTLARRAGVEAAAPRPRRSGSRSAARSACGLASRRGGPAPAAGAGPCARPSPCAARPRPLQGPAAAGA